MRVTILIPNERTVLEAALQGLVAVNMAMMAKRRRFPDLYVAGVRYQAETREGPEDWQNAEELLRSRRGDCEDLAAYRTAWLRVYMGERARARVVPSQRMPGKWHAILQRGDGVTEDPSERLGMGKRR